MPTTTTKQDRPRSRPGARSNAVAAAAAAPDASWMSAAACTNQPNLPWIGDFETTTTGQRLVMAAVCSGCPVLTACDRYATDQDLTGGFWAGAPRDLDAPANLVGPGWTINPLPGLDTLDTLGRLGGAA